VYGRDDSSVVSFLDQVTSSASRFKQLNPELKVGIWTTSEQSLSFFDFVGRISIETVVNDRQWLTRINYMRCSPFRLTLAVDTQALACSEDVFSMLSRLNFQEAKFDLAFNSKYYVSHKHRVENKNDRTIFESHNWMMLYRMNSQTKTFLDSWFYLHAEEESKSPGRDDQASLAKTLKRNLGLVRVARLCNNFAVAFVEDHAGTDKKHRATHELSSGPCHIFHLAVSTEAQANRVCSECGDSSRVRIHVQRHKTNFDTVYSQVEYDHIVNSSLQKREWSEIPCHASDVIVPDLENNKMTRDGIYA